MKEQLDALFEQAARSVTGPLGVGFMDLVTGEEVYYGGDTVFPTASVYKIFVLCELFRQQKEGLFSFSERHTLIEKEKSVGSGILELIGEGAVFSLMDYAILMIAISDNTAADYLYERAGWQNIQKHIIAPLGMHNTMINAEGPSLVNAFYGLSQEDYRKVLAEGGRFHARNGSYFRCAEAKNKQSAPRDMVKLLSRIHQGAFTDSKTDRLIIDVLLKCQSTVLIPAKLPAGVRVAHKSGSIDHLANDCGIIYTEYGAYILALFYNGNLASEEEYEGTEWISKGKTVLSQLSYDIYQLFIRKHGEPKC